MKKLSSEKVAELKKNGMIIKQKLKNKEKILSSSQSIEKSLQDLTGYVKTIITKDDNNEIIIKTASNITKVLKETVENIKSIQPQTQITEWDISVERDRNDFIEHMTLKAVN